MSTEITAIYSHSLNTDSLPELAAQLSERFNVSIAYGYQDNLVVEGISNQTYEFVTLGKIERDSEDEWLLEDSQYLDNIVDPSKHNGHKYFVLYYSYGDRVCYIYKHIIESAERYINGWWRFCEHFTGELHWWNYVNWFRKAVENEVKIMGAEAAIYYGDYGVDGFMVIMCEESATFQEVFNKIKEVYPNRFTNITDFLTNQPEPLPYIKTETAEDCAMAFYDDFKVFREEKEEEE